MSPDIAKYPLAGNSLPWSRATALKQASLSTPPSALPTESDRNIAQMLGSLFYQQMSHTRGPKPSHVGNSSQCGVNLSSLPLPRHTLSGAPTLQPSPLVFHPLRQGLRPALPLCPGVGGLYPRHISPSNLTQCPGGTERATCSRLSVQKSGLLGPISELRSTLPCVLTLPHLFPPWRG